MPISAPACRFHPGSVNSGSVWHDPHLPAPLKISSPRAAAARSKLPAGGVGAGMLSWYACSAGSFGVIRSESGSRAMLPKPFRRRDRELRAHR